MNPDKNRGPSLDQLLEAGLLESTPEDRAEGLEALWGLRDAAQGLMVERAQAGPEPDGLTWFLLAHTLDGALFRVGLRALTQGLTLRIEARLEQRRPGAKPELLASESFAVPLVWCPVRRRWLGRVVRRNGHPLHAWDDPRQEMIRNTVDAEIEATTAVIWTWAEGAADASG
ncbi:MAG: hypothetical protein H6741_12875 [Alphaproteobacteria bacterium]|nr:hypothetical protein [Alphaproteobacteria bacterium]MCB9793609.1 hypothetical protein [Alphaproteobacteria bacterium]